MYWLLCLILDFVRSIYVVACSCTSFVFITLNYFIVQIIAQSIIFTIDGHSSYLELLCLVLERTFLHMSLSVGEYPHELCSASIGPAKLYTFSSSTPFVYIFSSVLASAFWCRYFICCPCALHHMVSPRSFLSCVAPLKCYLPISSFLTQPEGVNWDALCSPGTLWVSLWPLSWIVLHVVKGWLRGQTWFDC